MKRVLTSSNEIVFGQGEVVVEISQTDVGIWALEISLLLLGLSESLTVRQDGGVLLLSLHSDERVKRAVVSHRGSNEPVISLARTQAEYLQAILLRTYRDGLANVEHFHIEGGPIERTYGLTVFFGASRTPMSSEEAAGRMRD